MATVLKVQLSTANGDSGTITIKNPRADITVARVNAGMSGFLTGASQLKHRSSVGDGYTTVSDMKLVTETDVPEN